MQLREGSPEGRTYFRTDRFFRVNNRYYFQVREGADQGPYPDLATAKLMLQRYLSEQSLRRPYSPKTPRSLVAPAPIHKKPAAESARTGNDHETTGRETPASRKKREESHAKTSRKGAAPINKPGAAEAAAKTRVRGKKRVETQPEKPAFDIQFHLLPVEEYQLGAPICEIRVTPEDETVQIQVRDPRFEIRNHRLKLRDNAYFDYAADMPVQIEIQIERPATSPLKKVIVPQILPVLDTA